MSEREKLIEELRKAGVVKYGQTWEKLADFILSDRKRIVEPLVKYKASINELQKWPNPHNAIEDTLRLADGGEKG